MIDTVGRRQCVRCGAWLARDNRLTFCSPCQLAGGQMPTTRRTVPSDFWLDPELQSALASRHMGLVIRAYRTHPHHGRRGLSQDDIAAWAGVVQGQVSKIETGPASQRLDRLTFWARLLDIPEELLWFKLPSDDRPAGQDGERRRRPSAPDVITPDDLLPAVTVEPWELYDALTRSSISPGAVTQLEMAMLRCAERYPTASPQALGPAINRQLTRITEALTGPQPLTVRQRLVRVLGYLSGLAANICIDLHDPAMASAFFDVAMQASHESSDMDLAAWIAANRATAHHFGGSMDQSLPLLHRAAHQARAHSSRRRCAWVLALQARGAATSGNRRQAMGLLEESEETLSDATEPGGGTDFFDANRLEGLKGSTLLLLGDYQAADDALTAAARRRADSEVKGRALLALDLARCRLLQREHDDAVSLIAASLELASGSLIQPITAKATKLVSELRAAGAGDRLGPVVDRLVELKPKALGGPS